jgi:MFS family permease
VATASVAYAFAVTMIGTTMPTPLYPIYEQRFDFSALTVTIVFAAYGLGVLAALVLFGQLCLIWLMPERAALGPDPGARRPRIAQLGVPVEVRGTFIRAGTGCSRPSRPWACSPPWPRHSSPTWRSRSRSSALGSERRRSACGAPGWCSPAAFQCSRWACC